MLARIALLLMVVLLLSSCKTTPRPTPPNGQVENTPTYESLVSHHNERIKKFRGINAGGSIEMRWTDDDGDHFETCLAEVWIKLPDKTALNIQKLGERLMWLGSNGDDAWVMTFAKEEKVLYVYGSDERKQEDSPTRLPIEPSLLLKMLGLSKITIPENAKSKPVDFDAERDAWILSVPGEQRSLRLYFDREKKLPIRIEYLTAEGKIQMYSELLLRRYDTVEMVGLIPGTQPMFPTLVDIYNTQGLGEIKLALRQPVDDVKDHFFDLDWIIRTFKPDRIEREVKEPATP